MVLSEAACHENNEASPDMNGSFFNDADIPWSV